MLSAQPSGPSDPTSNLKLLLHFLTLNSEFKASQLFWIACVSQAIGFKVFLARLLGRFRSLLLQFRQILLQLIYH
jgi:hypothetical protein